MKRSITGGLMRNGMRALAFVSILAVSAASASADTTWNLVGVNFSDGATETGFFTIDPSFSVLTNWDITVSGSSYGPLFEYTPASSKVYGVSPTDVILGDFVVSQDYTLLFFSGPMTNAGGTISLDASSLDCFNGPCGTLESGEITSQITKGEVPEPGSILMSACGAFFLGLALYRRRRASAGAGRDNARQTRG